MSETQISPSQSVESSLLQHIAPVSDFTPQDTLLPSSTPHLGDMSARPPPDEDAMEHEPSPTPQPIEQPIHSNHTADSQDHDRMAMEVDTANESAPVTQATDTQTSSPPSQLTAAQLISVSDQDSPPPPQAPQVLVAVQSAHEDMPTTEGIPSPSPQPDAGGPSAPEIATERDPDAPSEEFDEDEDEEDDDQSDDDDDFWGGDRDFLDRLKEDTSTPSEDELNEMKQMPEQSALDDQHWESAIYTSFDDPEYVPAESGKITWTLKGFHGTKEAPNKQRIMRSPQINIGGYQWNLKIFPHGNEGTDHISVYVECNGPENTIDPKVVQADDVNMQGMPTEDTSSSEDTKSPEAVAADPSIDGSFEVAAQIGCVMYNAEDPRVQTFEKATHQFHNASKDWGWVRFYGPWTNIHRRRAYQHQAMLRNDTLCFTAFIRIVKDPTRSLWFKHTDSVIWDSVLKTGLRGLTADDSSGNAFVAALAPWLHLHPFKRLVLDTPTPKFALEPRKRPKPLLQSLRDIMVQKHYPANISPGLPVSLEPVKEIVSSYGLNLRQPTDIVEIWEMIRDALNAECSGDMKSSHSSDTLSFMKMIKQAAYPSIPSASVAQAPEPRSVQELVDMAHQEDQKSYIDWNGQQPISSETPEVLQIELNRQRYDPVIRKWKKLTHNIKMNENIKLGKMEYTLFAMVISKGELGSGRVYTIVRSGEATSRWARYKGGQVTYITRKQAVDSHEGKSLSREGTESVAYLVLYVRKDACETVLPTPTTQPTSKVLSPLTIDPSAELPDMHRLKSVPIVIHNAQKFGGFQGMGFVDQWSADTSNTYDVSLAPTSKLGDVQKALVDQHHVAERPDQCRLWSIAGDPFFAPKLRNFDLNTQLIDLTYHADEGLHLWMSIIPIKDINLEGSYFEPPAPFVPPPPPSIPTIPPPEAQDIVMGGTQEPEHTVIIVDGGVPNQPTGQLGEASDFLIETSRMEPVTVPGQDTLVPGAPVPSEIDPVPEVGQGNHTANPPLEISSAEPAHTDLALTEESQDQPGQVEEFEAESEAIASNSESAPVEPTSPQPLPAEFTSQPPPPPAVEPVPTEKICQWQLNDHTYILFKVFDPRNQSVVGLSGHLLPRNQQLSEIIETKFPDLTVVKAYQEYASTSIDVEIPLSLTLEFSCLANGSVLVLVAGNVSENDLEIIRDRGDAAEVKDFYEMLSITKLYSYRSSQLIRSYFGGAFVQYPLHKGRAYGESKIIDTTGDAYLGNCVRGFKSGTGTMYYANGNTYTGDWVNSLPEGQGTMIYSPTGNRYVGGWKNGRKHGKGIMTYEVADEEMQLCKICYDCEMDALFYRCGHVAACESCARQVRDCPVCRRPVDAVVKIWRT